MTGELPSMKTIKRIILTVAAAVSWFLPAHLIILALLVFFWGSTMISTTNTAKTRVLETRLNSHIAATAPAVNLVANGGTIGGSLTVNGDHTVSGDLTMNGANAFINGGLTVQASATIQGNHTVQGSQTIDTNQTVNGTALINNLNVANTTNTTNFQVNSTQMFIPFTDEGNITGTPTAAQFNALLNRLRGSNLMA